MMDRKRKQIAALVRLREHKEKRVRADLQRGMDKLRSVDRQKTEKENLVAELADNLYMGLEDRLMAQTNVTDHGARFTTFAMSVNAERENLLLEKGLASKLEAELISVRNSVIIRRNEVKNAHLQVKKVTYLSDSLEADHRKSENRKEEASTEEITNSSLAFKY